jgi:hypothetical protein
MHRTVNRSFIYALLVAFAITTVVTVRGQEKDKQEVPKGQYQNIEVVNFDVKDGIEFPPDYMKPMMDEIATRLIATKKFKQVLRPGETASETSVPTLQIIGTVVDFKAGSRAKRYVISMGAGKTRVVTHFKFIDKSTGNIVYEGDASGGVSWGLFGGDSKEAVTGVGKQIAKAAKEKLF